MRWFPTRVDSDPKSGGAFRYTWEFEEASKNGAQEGKYTDVVADKRVAYTWQPSEDPENLTQVVVNLSGNGEETNVHLVHSGWNFGEENAKMIEMHAGPWMFYLQNLKGYLEQGADGRAEQLKQVVVAA